MYADADDAQNTISTGKFRNQASNSPHLKVPFCTMVLQEQNKRSNQTLMSAAVKNHPIDKEERLYPESTPDGRHMTNSSHDLMHVTKRAQVLN